MVRNGGFAAAESELKIAQSTISNHITALEQRLGVRLCRRGRVGFQLTEKGSAVHAAACRLFAAVHDLDADLGALRGTLTGELRIGILDCVATDPSVRLHEAIARLSRRAGEISFVISQDPPPELQTKVHDGIYHCGIGSFPHKTSGLDYQPLYREWHHLYCGRDHPLFDVPDERITPERLRATPIIRRGYWRERDERRFSLGPVKATVQQIEPQLMLIRSGRLIGFLPDHYAAAWVQAGEIRPLLPDRILFNCTFDIVTRKGVPLAEIAQAFVREVIAAHRPVPAAGPGPASAPGPGHRRDIAGVHPFIGAEEPDDAVAQIVGDDLP